jgi:hypothetical protein
MIITCVVPVSVGEFNLLNKVLIYLYHRQSCLSSFKKFGNKSAVKMIGKIGVNFGTIQRSPKVACKSGA